MGCSGKPLLLIASWSHNSLSDAFRGLPGLYPQIRGYDQGYFHNPGLYPGYNPGLFPEFAGYSHHRLRLQRNTHQKTLKGLTPLPRKLPLSRPLAYQYDFSTFFVKNPAFSCPYKMDFLPFDMIIYIINRFSIYYII